MKFDTLIVSFVFIACAICLGLQSRYQHLEQIKQWNTFYDGLPMTMIKVQDELEKEQINRKTDRTALKEKAKKANAEDRMREALARVPNSVPEPLRRKAAQELIDIENLNSARK